MGLSSVITSSLIVAICAILVYRFGIRKPVTHQPPEWRNFGSLTDENAKLSESLSPKPFKVTVTESDVADYRRRLEQARFPPVMSKEVNMTFGYPSHALPSLRQQMLDVDLQQWASKLNIYDHHKVTILGLEVHYIRIFGDAGLPKVPLLLLHGWPGSFYEFYAAIPILLQKAEERGFTYDIIVPSLPGYGFSEAPAKPGCSPRYAAAMVNELMTSRLGYKEYVVQGGDWGAAITEWVVGLYPDNVIGFHLNMFNPPQYSADFRVLPYQLASAMFPRALLSPEEAALVEYRGVFSFFKWLLVEGGYLHIQATKPDTVGAGLTDSPLGLAAYILEKFYTWTDIELVSEPFDQATDKLPFWIDDVLTNVLIYWHSNSIGSSVRLYKEAVGEMDLQAFETTSVPAGVLMSKHEISFSPKCVVQLKLLNLKLYTASESGGHFAAFEQPERLSEEIVAFTSTLR